MTDWELPVNADQADEPEVDPEDPPREFAFVWETFRELSQTRLVGAMGGPSPICWSEIDSWCRVNRIRLNRFEILVIRHLDLRWMKVMGEAYARLSSTESGDR